LNENIPHDHASEVKKRFPRLETMSWFRATASIKASTERDPRDSLNLQARKLVPFKLATSLLLGLLVFCAPYVLAAEIAVCFTPEYGITPSCTQEVVDAPADAKKSVLVQAYSFTSAPIAKALVDADDDTILTGCFNFTKAAEQQNAKNLLTIRDSAFAEKYTANWQKRLEHSEPYKRLLSS
jgi:phosphatidylserine/phosphatidylglycerophosphate/cardiolipin synthase-like enzyme